MLSTKAGAAAMRTMMNLLAYADGEHDLIAIAERLGVAVEQCQPIVETLIEAGLLTGMPEGAGSPVAGFHGTALELHGNADRGEP